MNIYKIHKGADGRKYVEVYFKSNERYTTEATSRNGEINLSKVDCVDELTLPVGDRHEAVLISAVREIYRNYNVNMVPHVHAFIMLSERNEYGDKYIAEIQYDKCGWRGVYGGHYDARRNKMAWQCYMD